jgi:hypothetical protein
VIVYFLASCTAIIESSFPFLPVFCLPQFSRLPSISVVPVPALSISTVLILAVVVPLAAWLPSVDKNIA